MNKITNQYEFEIIDEDINDFISFLDIAHKDIKLDKVILTEPKENSNSSYYVIFGNTVFPNFQVLFQVDATASSFKISGSENEEECIDLSYNWRKFLLSKYKEEYAKYFVYNWEEISGEYMEIITLIEKYLKEAKKQYEQVLQSYEETLEELQKQNNTR